MCTETLTSLIQQEFALDQNEQFDIYKSDSTIVSMTQLIDDITRGNNIGLGSPLRLAVLNENKCEGAKNHENLFDQVAANLYQCRQQGCRKTFNEVDRLYSHMLVHSKNKPHTCPVEGCNKSFLTKGQCNSHLEVHNQNKTFSCKFPGCDKSYGKKSRLDVHYRTHTGEKPFKCPECGKGFTEKGNLKTHFRIHTGEKPYKCSFTDCGKKFSTQGHLIDHERRHTGNKPFRCDICGRKYMRNASLKVHLRTHTGERPFSCNFPGCAKSFKEGRSLRVHVQKAHNTGSLTDPFAQQKSEKQVERVPEGQRTVPPTMDTMDGEQDDQQDMIASFVDDFNNKPKEAKTEVIPSSEACSIKPALSNDLPQLPRDSETLNEEDYVLDLLFIRVLNQNSSYAESNFLK